MLGQPGVGGRESGVRSFGPVGGKRDAHLVLDSQILVDGDGRRPRCSRSQLQQSLRHISHVSVLSGQLHRRPTGRTDLHGFRLGLCARLRLLEGLPRLGLLPGPPTRTLQRCENDSLLLRARLRQRRLPRPFLRERRMGLSGGLRLLGVLPQLPLLPRASARAPRRGNRKPVRQRHSRVHLLRGGMHEPRDHLPVLRRLRLALPRGLGLASGLPGPAVLPRRVTSPHEGPDGPRCSARSNDLAAGGGWPGGRNLEPGVVTHLSALAAGDPCGAGSWRHRSSEPRSSGAAPPATRRWRSIAARRDAGATSASPRPAGPRAGPARPARCSRPSVPRG